MNDRSHRTDIDIPKKGVIIGSEPQLWVEFQLLDEQGAPLANLPFRAVNDATRANVAAEYSGHSDANGVIRLEGLHAIDLTLRIAADPLAEQLQGRRLRPIRPEPAWPGFGQRIAPYGPQPSGFSPIEKQALAAGHGYHYLRIGQLCDQPPGFLEDGKTDALPAYHFPDNTFSGFTLHWQGLDRRHILEVCPLRAWSLELHHQDDYSLANAYNLGLMSILAYSDESPDSRGSVQDFFERQCLDLSRTPKVLDDGQNWPCLVTDVPFSERYATAELLDTTQAYPPEGNTQLFYAISASQVLVAWRGTEPNLADFSTDLTFRPVKPEVQANCQPKVACADLTAAGSVHLGFRDAYALACRKFPDQVGEQLSSEGRYKDVFICGHSLGGALGLIHAAALKDHSPLLYTYGMPRTFTLRAVECLEEVRHFRHVNDTDPIPDVPPDADLNNRLYDLYGPLGSVLGTFWSLAQLLADPVIKGRDPFCHHGELAVFYRADQHLRARGSSYPAYRSKDGLGAPYYATITQRLPKVAKLYLVPSLSESIDRQARDAQACFIDSLNRQSLATYFPPRDNPKPGRLLQMKNHFMGQYQPYLHNQLLETLDPERMQERRQIRLDFEAQMIRYSEDIPLDQYTRNRQFLDLQNLIGETLQVTRTTDAGREALQRFDAVADANAHFEKIYG